MPELPEVQTTVDGLKKTVVGLKIQDVWTDLAKKNQKIPHFKDTLKDVVFYRKFKENIVGTKIISAERRAKNILINLSNRQTILVHMKMTGHMMFGQYEFDTGKNKWNVSPKEKNEALQDPFNRFIHVVFMLNNNKQLVLCDSRKFAKVTLITTENKDQTSHLKNIGPEPLEKNFTLEKFTARLLQKPTGKIKQVLLDQSIIAGIGNIYSDEMLWLSGIHPLRKVKDISKKEFGLLYASMKKVLEKGIDFGGDSTSDYRQIDGTPGKFHQHHNVYRKTKSACGKKGCSGVIMRTVVGGRSAHFCSVHQK